jgi:RNA polymerase sigma factor (sigma-70 family)
MKLLRTKYKDLTDEGLMIEISKGKEVAFRELYDRYANPLYRYFYNRMWKNHEKAQDFVQDLMTKIIKNPDSFDSSRKFKTWIFSVANNMTINEYKKQSVRSNTTGGLDEDFGVLSDELALDHQVDLRQFKSALQQELEQMDEKHRQVFELRHMNGMSVKEIAVILKINEGTVKSRAFYAIKQLSSKLVAHKPSYT